MTTPLPINRISKNFCGETVVDLKLAPNCFPSRRRTWISCQFENPTNTSPRRSFNSSIVVVRSSVPLWLDSEFCHRAARTIQRSTGKYVGIESNHITFAEYNSQLRLLRKFEATEFFTNNRMIASFKMSAAAASRWKLHLQAQTWRALMAVGMNLHKMAHPRPPGPTFRRRISTTVSPEPGEIDLLFYTPPAYNQRNRPRGNKTVDASAAPPPVTAVDPSQRGYPVLVNFHGGGFTIGQASDDERWADTVVRQVNAVVVSVEYRLAPEHPFPTAVEDGVDAILYLVANAEELGIDPLRIAVSGFSAGGNMAFTVPLKLQDVLHNPRPEKEQDRDGRNSIVMTEPAALNQPAAIFNPVAIVAWYPSTDFVTSTRAQRRSTNIRPEKELPEFFTKLFNASYLPLTEVALSSPYLSPCVAPLPMLRALPDHIIMYTCEWDELLVEAERMRDRLRDEAGKEVVYRKVEGVAHAWDKSPNPLKWDPSIEAIYKEACTALKRAFEVEAAI